MKSFRSVPILIYANVAVFLLWNFSSGHIFTPEFMMNNFLVSWTGLLEGRYWTLITSVFSHNMVFHIFMNMYVLSSFGSVIEEILGLKRFLAFYFIAGIFSSFCHAFVSAYLLHEPSLPALGASGAISGIIVLFSFMFPRQKILLLGIIPTPAFWGAIAFIGLDIWGLMAQAEGGGLPIGHGAHLGGALAGIVYYYLFIKPKISKQPIY
jgi:membrane associated rhomboid family serine protease